MKAPSTRQDIRILVNEFIAVPGDKRSDIAELLDISESGARLKVPARSAQEICFYWCPVAGVSLKLNGRIQWQKMGMAGIQFGTLSSREEFFLKALVRSHRNDG